MSTIFSTGKAAGYLGVSVKTLQRWDRDGRLKPERTSTGRRSYSKAMLDAFMKRSPSAARSAVAYCRVSGAAQKPDLKNQRRVLEDFCAARGVANTEFVEEAGGGLNLKRPKFVALMDRIEARQVSHLIIAHKDRLVRFGFPRFERFCAEHGTELLVLNNEQLSPEREMVPVDDRALFFRSPLRVGQLPQETQRGAENREPKPCSHSSTFRKAA